MKANLLQKIIKKYAGNKNTVNDSTAAPDMLRLSDEGLDNRRIKKTMM